MEKKNRYRAIYTAAGGVKKTSALASTLHAQLVSDPPLPSGTYSQAPPTMPAA